MSANGVLQRRDVVTAFLRHQGKVLLVRRSGAVRTYQGRWSAISGYLEEATPLAQARQEIHEETGLADDQARLVASGAPLMLDAPELGTRWMVHPFLFDIDDPGCIRLDWENLESRWVDPAEMVGYPTVPGLAEAYRACLEGHDGDG